MTFIQCEIGICLQRPSRTAISLASAVRYSSFRITHSTCNFDRHKLESGYKPLPGVMRAKTKRQTLMSLFTILFVLFLAGLLPLASTNPIETSFSEDPVDALPTSTHSPMLQTMSPDQTITEPTVDPYSLLHLPPPPPKHTPEFVYGPPTDQQFFPILEHSEFQCNTTNPGLFSICYSRNLTNDRICQNPVDVSVQHFHCSQAR